MNYLLPSNGVLGFHVTLEGFSRFDSGKNGSPHYWRGGISAQGNWKTRPKSVPEDSWSDVSSLMQARLASEVKRVGDLVAGFRLRAAFPAGRCEGSARDVFAARRASREIETVPRFIAIKPSRLRGNVYTLREGMSS
ncbi:MAG TPA: hypothetical protein VM942_00980 [Acidimicrobiales bacterium]|nr:hypothetical protein [Acidimicrobiales bacterium]